MKSKRFKHRLVSILSGAQMTKEYDEWKHGLMEQIMKLRGVLEKIGVPIAESVEIYQEFRNEVVVLVSDLEDDFKWLIEKADEEAGDAEV